MSKTLSQITSSSARIAALALGLPSSILAISACQVSDDSFTESDATTLRAAPISECVTLSPSDDAMIANPPKQQNYGAHPLLRVGGKDESLLRFDLSTIPAEAQIDSASLQLYVNGGAGQNPINVHRATAAWSAATVSFQSFNQQFDAAVEGVILPSSPNALKSVNLTGLVGAWLSGALPNYGVLLETSGNQKTIFVSSENGNPEYRPALEVCYTLPVEDACDPDPCQNGGTCANVDEGYACACPAGYAGVDCEIDIDECAGDPCQNGGTCSDGVNDYSCACPAGYAGVNCEIDIDECASNPCQNGICTDLIDAYQCDCDPGFSGTHCEIDIDECAGDPCQNGGVCTDGVNGYTCACPVGYDGANCELDIDDCVGNACQNDSTCVDGVADYTCACLPGFSGDLCEVNVDECASNPCLNGGSCSDGVNSYTCQCPAGFDGVNCEVDIDECAGNQCIHGLCVDGVNSYTCECDEGWTGPNCDQPDVIAVTCPCSGNPTWEGMLSATANQCFQSPSFTIADLNFGGWYRISSDSYACRVADTYGDDVISFATTDEESMACMEILDDWLAASGLACYQV